MLVGATPATPLYHPPKRIRSLDTTLATSATSRLRRRQRGALRLSALLAAATGALAIAGQQADPAAMPLAPVGAPNGILTIGAVIALTGNANVYGQDQKIGLELALQHRNGAGGINGRPLKLALEDSGSDEPGANAAFTLQINRGVLALIGPTLSQQAFAADPIGTAGERNRVPWLGSGERLGETPAILRGVASWLGHVDGRTVASFGCARTCAEQRDERQPDEQIGRAHV
jgi:hypothetical protein